MTMTIGTMNKLLGAVALGLVVAGGNVAADASVRLPAEQMSGMPSLAPLLRQVKAAVVTVAITGHSGPEKISSLNNNQRPRRSTYSRDVPAERQIKASGSGVVIDAQEGLIFNKQSRHRPCGRNHRDPPRRPRAASKARRF
jgi:S1-C subfamily serine protease